jgi:hypothetical protein
VSWSHTHTHTMSYSSSTKRYPIGACSSDSDDEDKVKKSKKRTATELEKRGITMEPSSAPVKKTKQTLLVPQKKFHDTPLALRLSELESDDAVELEKGAGTDENTRGIICRYKRKGVEISALGTGDVCSVVVTVPLEPDDDLSFYSDNFEELAGAKFKAWEKERPNWTPIDGERAPHCLGMKNGKVRILMLFDFPKEPAAAEAPAAAAAAVAKPRARSTVNRSLTASIVAVVKKIVKLFPGGVPPDVKDQEACDAIRDFWNDNFLMISLVTGNEQKPIKFKHRDDTHTQDTVTLHYVYAACHMFKLHTERVYAVCLVK